MTEDPEEVLPEDRVATAGWNEEMRPGEAVEHQQDERDRDHREREQKQDHRDEAHPDEHRHPHEAHAGRAQIDDGDEEVDRGCQRRDAEDLQARHPEVYVGPGRKLPRRQIGVPEPARVGRGAEQEARVEEKAAQNEHPHTERIEPRKCDVPRPQHERDHVVEEHLAQRHDREEDHRRAVHGEQLVVELRRHEGIVGLRELNADEQRLDPAEEEEGQRADPVENRDPLVVDRRDPAPEAGLLAVSGADVRFLTENRSSH